MSIKYGAMTKIIDKKNRNQTADCYYNEKGLMVFTEAYHLKRGYCCKNSCKHCPYSNEKNRKGFDL